MVGGVVVPLVMTVRGAVEVGDVGAGAVGAQGESVGVGAGVDGADEGVGGGVDDRHGGLAGFVGDEGEPAVCADGDCGKGLAPTAVVVVTVLVVVSMVETDAP